MLAKLAAMGGGASQKQYVDDVFSTWLYQGNGSSQTINNGINLVGNLTAAAQNVKSKFATSLYTGNGGMQTIDNGIDLAGKGGLVWVKGRNSVSNNCLYDTFRGIGKHLITNYADAQAYFAQELTAFNANGFGVGSDSYVNQNNANYVSWTFRRAPKFFDVVTFTTDANGNAAFNHALGVSPGLVITKCPANAQGWNTWHQSLISNKYYLQLNTVAAQASLDTAWITSDANTVNIFGAAGAMNPNQTYVAYLFAHDAAADGIIQCGSFTTDSSGNATVNLGWKPQYLLVKTAIAGSGDDMNWQIYDAARGLNAAGQSDSFLYANTSGSETTGSRIGVTDTGFSVALSNSSTSIYLAIRTDKEYDGSSGGMVWTKCRSSGTSGTDGHRIHDTLRGYGYRLSSETTNGQVSTNITGSQFGITSFNNNGYSLMDGLASTDLGYNYSGKTYVSWTFRKAPKFFDVVTYTGDGLVDKKLTHSLGVEPGLIIIKSTSASSTNWVVQHRDLRTSRQYLLLNTTAAGVATSNAPTAISWDDTSSFYVHGAWPTGTGNDLNTNGATYVAYLFAHDPSADGIIQCGSFTTDTSWNATVNLGWEPQWLYIKRVDSTGHHLVLDNMRDFSQTDEKILFPNSNSSEFSYGAAKNIYPTATGFGSTGASQLAASATYIYLAIRRQNKPPTSGTEVFNTVAQATTSGDNLVNTGFPSDVVIRGLRGTAAGKLWGARLLGAPRLDSTGALAESATYPYKWATQQGVIDGSANSGYPAVYWNFRRAPGFMDTVCFTSTGSTNRQLSHNLATVPELAIMKGRSVSYGWGIYHAALGRDKYMYLNDAGYTLTEIGVWTSTAATSTTFNVNEHTFALSSGSTAVLYLFASLPGISKVGSFTKVAGSALNVDCGFTSGARFVLLKRTDADGDWYVADRVRGLVADADPYLLLNSTAAEVTTLDWIDPYAAGFSIPDGGLANGSYIFLAIA